MSHLKRINRCIVALVEFNVALHSSDSSLCYLSVSPSVCQTKDSNVVPTSLEQQHETVYNQSIIVVTDFFEKPLSDLCVAVFIVSFIHLHRVSKNCAKLFLSELR